MVRERAIFGQSKVLSLKRKFILRYCWTGRRVGNSRNRFYSRHSFL